MSLALSCSLLVSLCPVSAGSVLEAASGKPLLALPGTAAGQPGRAADRRAGELLVRFRAEVSEHERNTVAHSRRARRARLRGGSGVERFELAAGQAPEAVAAELRSLPTVELVEPNFLISAGQSGPDDTRFAEQWALSNTGQSGGQLGSDIGARAAWRSTTGSPRVTVAVIDGGVDFTHPDLAGNQWENARERVNNRDDDNNGLVDDLHGWDWVTQSNRITDPSGHGTAVAGIIAAEGNNGEGVAGVMWRAGLMSLRVLDATGTGDVAAAVEAIDYAVEEGAHVINLSWGTDGESLALKDAIERAGRSGVLVVCSAGNDGRNIDGAPYYPASFRLPNVIAVAATDNGDRLAAWSNWGALAVSVAAPGGDILTTQPGGGYRTMTGTSAAAPVVSGIAGLAKSSRSTAGAADLRAAITGGARRVAGLDGVVAAGGVANAAGAIQALSGMTLVGGGNGNGQGGGGNNGNGNGNGNGGNGQGHGPSVQPGRPGRGSGGRGAGGGFNVAPSLPTKDAPPNFMNQDEARRRQPAEPKAPTFIRADTVLPICDADCGGIAPPGGAGAGNPNDPYFGTARGRPENETGRTGVDLGSRNFNWGAPLVSLAGRAGLDLGIGIYYNSLVWTKQGRTVQFNADRSFPGPGFRLGFPTLQPRYQNGDTGIYAYILTTPSGGRVEMRQTATGAYESADGTYTQLVENADGTMLVRTTDGTQLKFVSFPSLNEYRCVEIKDRNGNYITVNYDPSHPAGALGRPTSVVDTLGRTVTFNYDAQQYLASISQTWRRDTTTGTAVPETHNWATFSYGALTLQTNFADAQGTLERVGPLNGTQIPVLTHVGLADGTYYYFEYTSWGQVYRISRRAPDHHTLARTSYNLPIDAGATQTDCPRFTERSDWAEHANGDDGNQIIAAAEEAVTTYSVDPAGAWAQVTPPDPTPSDASDNVVYKELFATTGWQKGLTTRTEIRVNNVLKKSTETSWTQDDITLTYAKNPRPTDVAVEDSEGNRRRTAVEYSAYGLPSNVREYTGPTTGETLRRRTFTEYRWEAEWIDRRIIGLVGRRQAFEGESALVSKVEYGYDWGGNGFSFQDTAATAISHDRTTYGPAFVMGRGNLSWVGRYDVTEPSNTSKVSETKLGVNTTGSIVAVADHDWHQTKYDYADSFSAGVAGQNTFAYPTKVTDAGNFETTLQYNYDLGAPYRSQDPKGAAAKTLYDAAGRVERVVNEANGAYTYYSYDPGQGHTKSYSTIEANKGEAYTNSIADGAGRPRLFVAAHPGSVGTYLATRTVYDKLGRAAERTNPTEIYGNGVPAGDDIAGYQWTRQSYDWQGRPTLTIYPAVGSPAVSNTTELTYGGCGCAGGEVTTASDERGRKKRYTKDGLARLAKVEELDWEGVVYSTTDYSYNGRDQITGVSQPGLSPRTFEYDGHGRLWKRTTPEQGLTEYGYNNDDTTAWVKDARGAKTLIGYNSRHLPETLTYDLSNLAAGQSVAATANVSYGYDAAGNRTSMQDGLGSASYVFDTQSRLESETRTFTGLNPYTHSYDYNLAGQLARITNPWGMQIAYVRDTVGQVTDVLGAQVGGGQPFGNVGTYAKELKYRAFGAVKSMAYGDGTAAQPRTLSTQFDARLRLKRWDVAGVLGYDYSYDKFAENSFRVTYAQNISHNGAAGGDATLNRSYDYDHAGRLWEAHAGNEADSHANGTPWPSTPNGPFSHSYRYDGYGNQTYRVGWGGFFGSYLSQYQTFTNNRRDGLTYDAAGNLTNDGAQYAYDATGQQTSGIYPAGWGGYANYALSQSYDGDGLRGKKVDNGVTTYYVRSSVLGAQVTAEVRHNGVAWDPSRGYVYGAGGGLLAILQGGVQWVHQDPVTKGQRLTDAAGNVTSTVDVDPWGGETARSNNSLAQPRKYTTYERDGSGNDQAMFRQYHGYWHRFDQPDPYDGSYNLTDPQSLNRYAYTQNDPVNFVDPSGLDGITIDTGPPVIVTGTIDSPARGGTLSSLAALIGGGGTVLDESSPTDGGGDGGGGVGGPQNPPKQDKFKDCADFVNYLVSLAKNLEIPASSGTRHQTPTQQAATKLGIRMMGEAFDYKYIASSIEGFKQELTQYGQNAGAHGHVLLQAGGILEQWGSGAIISGAFRISDHIQRHGSPDPKRNAEALSEIAGNAAGRRVGQHMSNFIFGTTPREEQRLRNSLTSELCE